MTEPRTLFAKIWEAHVVHEDPGSPALLYVDLQLLHEVTSPQAFEGLRLAKRRVRRPDLTLATVDHNVPTLHPERPWSDPLAVAQVEALVQNCERAEIPLFDVEDPRQGIVHVVGPEQGLTQPGMVIVCGDSHTATHGAFGALALGIGTSEVEHVLATQTLPQKRPRTMTVEIDGELPEGVAPKDVILSIIHRIGAAGGRGHVIEYRGGLFRSLGMEGRMTVCNMTIEAGARAGMMAPDEKTFAYLEGRPFAPRDELWHEALKHWRRLATDEGARFDRTVRLRADELEPRITWGTNPAQSVTAGEPIPDPRETSDGRTRDQQRRALEYMALTPGTRMHDVPIDRVFIGSCTNARIEDLRAAARVVEGRRVATRVEATVVPGSGLVKSQAEAEGLAEVFREAGLSWRDPGCSMCLGMNPDVLEPGQRCASTSNRNFEGRQGRGGRTHLVSPAMAAAAAIAGHFVDVREVLR